MAYPTSSLAFSLSLSERHREYKVRVEVGVQAQEEEEVESVQRLLDGVPLEVEEDGMAYPTSSLAFSLSLSERSRWPCDRDAEDTGADVWARCADEEREEGR
jgi:hypothetical protein